MLPKQYAHLFTVTGRSSFPVDMLRYDAAIPATEGDSGVIGYSFMPRRTRDELPVTLRAYGPRTWTPTSGRWESFGWHVVDQQSPREV